MSTADGALLADCEEIRKLLIENINAIRNGGTALSSPAAAGSPSSSSSSADAGNDGADVKNAPKTTSIHVIASKIYRVVSRNPKAFSLLFDMLKDAIEADMVEHFTLPITTGLFGRYPSDTRRRIAQMAAERQEAGATQQQQGGQYSTFVFRHDPPETIAALQSNGGASAGAHNNSNTSRQVFPFISAFARTLPSILKAIRFSAQYIDNAYGVRCRHFTLTDYAYRVIEKCFWSVRDALYGTLFRFLDEIRIGGEGANSSATSSSSFDASSMREVKAVVGFILEMSERNENPNLKKKIVIDDADDDDKENENGEEDKQTPAGQSKKLNPSSTNSDNDNSGDTLWEDFMRMNILSAHRCYAAISAGPLAVVTAASTLGSASSHTSASSPSTSAPPAASALESYAQWAASKINAERLLQQTITSASNTSTTHSLREQQQQQQQQQQTTTTATTAQYQPVIAASAATETAAEMRRWRLMRRALFATLVRPIYDLLEQSGGEAVARDLARGSDVSALYTLLESSADDRRPLGGVHIIANAVERHAAQVVKELLTSPPPSTSPSAESPSATSSSSAPPAAAEPSPPPLRRPAGGPQPQKELSPAAKAAAAEAQRLQHLNGQFSQLYDWAHAFFSVRWPQQFRRSPPVEAAMLRGLRAGLRVTEDSPKLCCDLVDSFLRGSRAADESAAASDDTDARLFTLLKLFDAILQKDEFIVHHKTMLASRLLRASGGSGLSSAAFTLESAFIRGMRSIVGNNDTFHLTSMMGDVHTSRTLTATFTEMVWEPYCATLLAASSPAAVPTPHPSSGGPAAGAAINNGRPFKAAFVLAASQYWPHLDPPQYATLLDEAMFPAVATATTTTPAATGSENCDGSAVAADEQKPLQSVRKGTISDLCPAIGCLLSRFQHYYASRHHTRRIRWSAMRSRATVQIIFGGVGAGASAAIPKQVDGTLLQAVFLLGIDQYQFDVASAAATAVAVDGPSANTSEKSENESAASKATSLSNPNHRASTAGLTPAELSRLSSVPIDVVRDTLASMTFDPRAGILAHFESSKNGAPPTPGGRGVIKEDTTFVINAAFRSQLRRIELPRPRTAKNTAASSAEQHQRNLREMRSVSAQIAIIRFMKSRGNAAFAELSAAVLSDLRIRFDAQPPLVKQSLDFLIDKGYVRRDEENPTLLVYIA